MSFEFKHSQSFEFKSTRFNYRLSYNGARIKHLPFESSLSSHKNMQVNWAHILTHDSHLPD